MFISFYITSHTSCWCFMLFSQARWPRYWLKWRKRTNPVMPTLLQPDVKHQPKWKSLKIIPPKIGKSRQVRCKNLIIAQKKWGWIPYLQTISLCCTWLYAWHKAQLKMYLAPGIEAVENAKEKLSNALLSAKAVCPWNETHIETLMPFLKGGWVEAKKSKGSLTVVEMCALQ